MSNKTKYQICRVSIHMEVTTCLVQIFSLGLSDMYLVFVCRLQYPMYSRDYVYVRRYDVDVENNLMILVSRWELKC